MTAPKAPAEEMEDIDPGLARERTELAWTRTATSFAALGGAILKTTPAIGALVLSISALIWVLGRISGRPRRAQNGERGPILLLITVAVTVVALAALVAALMGGKTPFTTQ
jgi:uncharacterized membrane protein YidH (DUF202 family)